MSITFNETWYTGITRRRVTDTFITPAPKSRSKLRVKVTTRSFLVPPITSGCSGAMASVWPRPLWLTFVHQTGGKQGLQHILTPNPKWILHPKWRLVSLFLWHSDFWNPCRGGFHSNAVVVTQCPHRIVFMLWMQLDAALIDWWGCRKRSPGADAFVLHVGEAFATF